MPHIYIALFERLLGKKIKAVIWTGLSDDKPSYRTFCSRRLMKKHAKKYGYILSSSYDNTPSFMLGDTKVVPVSDVISILDPYVSFEEYFEPTIGMRVIHNFDEV